MDRINYDLLLDTDNFNTFDLKLVTDVFLDFEKYGSLTDGILTDDLIYYYNFQNYNDVNSIYSLIDYSGRKCTGTTINDIGLTGIDTEYVLNLTGETISFNSGSTLLIKPVSGRSDVYPLSLEHDNFLDTQVLNLSGGFYQGFYKLDGYSYEMIPNRTEEGVTFDFWLNKTTDLNTNGLKSDRFFFFMGSRSENKFHNIFSGETGVTTTSGVLLSSQTGVTTDVNGFGFYYNENYIGYKQIINRQDDSGNTFINIYNTGKTFIADTSNPWINITITFTRDEKLIKCDECDCLIPEPILITEYSSGCTQDIPLSQSGVLKIFVNARPLIQFKIEEPILRRLNIDKDVQQGVPYNISIGGGTQGLYESITFGGIDPDDAELFMYENFGGTFKGKMGLASMYGVPLTVPQIIRNFEELKNIYKVIGTFGGPEIIINNSLIF